MCGEESSKVMKLRIDSRRIAVFAIFAAMVLALEILPIPFLTDIPLFGGFTLDPTGIPITIVFLAYGGIFSLILLPIMWVAIAYRNLIGSIFKGFAEFYTVLGLIIGKLVLRNRSQEWKVALPTYLVFGVSFRSVGMYITNVFFIQWLYGLTPEAAIALSATFVIPNIIQAFINVLIGILIFIIIPENLKIQAGFGDSFEEKSYEEITAEEIDSSSVEDQTD
jgi:riboflavin transporter FmnP